jgi:UDP-N-acetylglucosamine diphosphorylase/glucosamine-1-phosphate N-acetyltransferase
MRICLYEDAGVADLEPLTLTRPVFDLVCGQTSLAVKQARQFPGCPLGVVLRPSLADLYRQRCPNTPVNDLGWLGSEPTVLVNGRWLPPAGCRCVGSGPCVGLVGEEVVYAVVQPGHLAGLTLRNLADYLERWKTSLPRRPVGGRLVRFLWELVQANGQEIFHDWQALPPRKPSLIGGLPTVVGPQDQLVLDLTARVDPMVVVDTTNGPVIIEREAVISAFTRLEGPCVVGAQTQVHGARVRAGTTLGPQCRIGGEVEASIVLGHSNKYHEGFLGHAYLGEWVNLGAGTHNSDLRNDYGEISLTINGRVVQTGLNKVGCFLGDHTKTGLGTLLNTGTNAGIFCNLLPGTLLPRYIPSFASFWNQRLEDRAELPQLFQTAAEVMRRRGAVFTDAHTTLYRTLFEQTAAERRRALREAELRQLHRSA